ncbi:hypothetical protein [Haloferax sp. Atlit-48N]|uniref:Uncharacterized protein n=1 Tax=Haloferax sp. Atlit-48N TaxID=2077198 RepID=A0ACD5HWM2_9EURY|nr:hypothetical protein [Haloferax sp. Atlit-48N]
MSCDICGSRCQGRLCRDCELMERQEDDLEWRWDDLDDDLDDEEDDVDRGDGVATDGGNAEASLGAFETVAETLGISLDTLYRRLAHETPSNPREWEPPLPEAQEHAGAEEMHVALDVEPTTAQGGVSAELSDRVNQLYVEATTENVIFEVAEEFQSVSFSTTFAPDQAKAIGCALIAGSKRAADGNSGVIVRKFNLAGVDRGDGIETDGGRDQDGPLKVIESGTAYYYEDADESVRHEGRIEIYAHYIRLCGGPTTTWVPREQVQQVMEI